MNVLSHDPSEYGGGCLAVLKRRLIVGAAFLIVGMASLCGSAWAGAWSATYSLAYPVGDRDSRSSLRRIALEDARVKAANEVGFVVLNEQQLKDDKLVEQTRLVSAAMIRLRIQRESLSISGEQPQIEYVIHASVDDSELDRQLSEMRSDVRKDDLIARLSRENLRLRRGIESARVARVGATRLAPDSTEIDDEIGRYSADIESVRRRAYQVLNGVGSSFAAEDRASEEADLLEKVIMLPLLRSRLNVDVKPWRKRGGSMEVPVALSWEFDVAAMRMQALQFSTPYDLPAGLGEKGFCAHTEMAGYPSKQSAIGAQLLSDAVAIEVTLAGTKSYFVIGGEGDLGQFCVVDGPFSAPRTVLLSLPEAEAQAAGSISVKTVRMSQVAAGWKSMVRNDLLTGGL